MDGHPHRFSTDFEQTLLGAYHRANILSTADSLRSFRHHCKLGGGSASIPGTSVYRGSKWVGESLMMMMMSFIFSCRTKQRRPQDEGSRIVLPPETGEQLSLSLERGRRLSLYSIVETNN
jgi:hypothetical protein